MSTPKLGRKSSTCTCGTQVLLSLVVLVSLPLLHWGHSMVFDGQVPGMMGKLRISKGQTGMVWKRIRVLSRVLPKCVRHSFSPHLPRRGTLCTSSLRSSPPPCTAAVTPACHFRGNSRPGFWTTNPAAAGRERPPSVACRSRPLGRAFWRRANTCNQWESAHLSLSRLVALARVRTLAHTIPQESETWACVGSDKRTARRGKTSWKMKWPIDQTTYTLTRSLPPRCSAFPHTLLTGAR